VVNARDALSGGGTIRIRTGQDTDDAGQPRVFLAIQDNGVGMSEDIQRRVFEPFFTTKGAGGGTGLGLATVARVVEQSHATLALESAPGKGTTVTVSFGEVDNSGEHPTDASTGTPQKARVLVVEDDPGLRLFVREALEGCGVEVTTARDPEDALRILKLAPTAVDLVLSDVVMPHMSGPVLRDQARQWRVNVPFLFMTGAQAREGLENEAVLQKPFTTADVRFAVRSRLSESGAARTG
jgi:CheY-like chemotaxis protein